MDKGVSVGATNLYFSGKSNRIAAGTFTGFRVQLTVGVSSGGEIGGSFSYSRVDKSNFVLGYGLSAGFGAGISPFPGAGLSGNINYGYSFIPDL